MLKYNFKEQFKRKLLQVRSNIYSVRGRKKLFLYKKYKINVKVPQLSEIKGIPRVKLCSVGGESYRQRTYPNTSKKSNWTS